MCVASAVVLTVLISSSVSAKSTGLFLASKTDGHSFQTGDRNSPFSLDNDVKRTLLQQPEARCSECSTLRQNVYNETLGAWLVSVSVLDNSIVDIQCIVKCANASETIMLSADRTITPRRTVKIHKPLTITGFHEDVPISEGTYPVAAKKTVISCPEGSNEGIFDIQSGSVTIANLKIRNCSLKGDDSPVVIQGCKGNADNVQIHNVDFVRNRHRSQLVAFSAAKQSRCGTLDLINVNFRNNRATGKRSVLRLESTTIMRNVKIENNRRVDQGTGREFLEFAASKTSNDKLTLDGLVVRKNRMPIVRAKSGTTEILNSEFRENNFRTHHASMFQFPSGSKVEIRNCSFEKNTGEGRGMITLESEQYIEIRDSIFANNTESGSVIFSTGSELSIINSNFTSNNGTLNGGVIFLANSKATLNRTFFIDNRSDENGGSIFAINDSTLTVHDSNFTNNMASAGGCFYIEKSDVSIAGSTFLRNEAVLDGGAIRVEHGGCVCNDSVFEENSALDEGGAIHIESARYFTLQSVNFTSKHAALGSVVRIEKSRTGVILRDVHFRDGFVELTGAALYIDDSNVTIVGATFVNNSGPYGGAIYAKTFDITIKNATFVNNTATVMGGAISGDNGNITIKNTTFKENHSYLGGALQLYNTRFEASYIVFLNNHASEGGALLCKDSNVTIEPRERVDGKIPESEDFFFKYPFGIYAWGNTGIDGGGAINAKDSNLSIAYGTFSNNTAPEGGAIQVTSSDRSYISIFHSRFGENVADVRGGGIAVRSANEGNMEMKLTSTHFSRCIADQGGAVFLTSVHATIQDCRFVRNIAIEGGAALFRKDARLIENNETETKSADITIVVKSCLFKRNTAADYGGALAFRGEVIVNRSSITSEDLSAAFKFEEKEFSVSLKSVRVIRNRAKRDGGGVHGEAVSLEVQKARVTDNTSPRGGGLYLMRTRVTISESNINRNGANSSGGGIMLARQSNGTIAWTNFKKNSVSKDGEGGGLSLSGSNISAEYLLFEQNKATLGGGVNLMPGSKRNSVFETSEVGSSFLCLECTFSENEASTSGGGLNLQSQDGEVPIVAQLENCQFDNNSASVFGGGIHSSRPVDQTNCTNLTSCSHLVILNSSFTNNKAGRSGGSLLFNDRKRVLFNCARSTDNTSSLQFINESRASDLQANQQELWPQGYCPQWVYVEKDSKNSSSLVASYKRNCKITYVEEDNFSEIRRGNGSLEISETVPGKRLPDIVIECFDELGNLAKSDNNTFTGTLRSNAGVNLTVISVTDLKDGIWNITGLRNPPNETFTREYSYKLEITFSLDYVESINVSVEVRTCRVGEQKDNESGECKKCDATEYNFCPMSGPCKHCDDTLDCSGTYVVPKENFWQSSPCRVPAQKCLTPNACNETADLREKINDPEFVNISAALKDFSCDFSDAFRKEYQNFQCNEGYEDVLCGSCKGNYSRSLSFACTKCSGPAFSVFIVVSACVWLAAIAAITIQGSKTIEETLKQVSKTLHDIAPYRRFQLRESLPEETKMVSQEEKTEEDTTKLIPPNSKILKRSITGASNSTDSSYWIGYKLPTTSVTKTVETPEEINNLESFKLAKWKLCEVIKVTVNFMQAISVAAVINVEWTSYMLTVFDLSAFAGGASTALVTRAIQCFPWWNGTKYATYAGLVSSILVPTFVVLCIVVFFAIRAYKASKGICFFVKRSVLATLAICYFSYLSITKVAVMVFYCIGVRTDDDFSSEKETLYWALDTSIQCDDQHHKSLKVFGGILFAIFSVGFPLISAFILVLCRKDNEDKDPGWMTDILGFLYRAYKREFVYWESTVMLRKALLSAIAVFSYHLGGHSQGLLASCILSVCLFFQAIYKPYRVEFDTVNDVESLSLLISGITFTLAQFFMKDRTNEAVKVALSVFLMVLIIGFLVCLMQQLLVCLIEVFKADLRVSGELDDENKNSWSIVKTWVASRPGNRVASTLESWAASRLGTRVASTLETLAASTPGTWVASRLGFSERQRDGNARDDDFGDVELGSTEGEKFADNMPDSST